MKIITKSFAKIDIDGGFFGENLEKKFLITQKINLFDELEITKTKSGISIITEGEFKKIPNNRENIIYDIFSICEKSIQRTGEKCGFRIIIKKNIPFSCGFGGKNSNGACFLRFLVNDFALNVEENFYKEIFDKFGSEFEFFYKELPSCLILDKKVFDIDLNLKGKFAVAVKLENVFIKKELFSQIISNSNLSQNKNKIDFYAKISLEKSLNLGFEEIIKQNFLYGNNLKNIFFSYFGDYKQIENIFKKSDSIFEGICLKGGVLYGIFKDTNLGKTCFEIIQKKYKIGGGVFEIL